MGWVPSRVPFGVGVAGVVSRGDGGLDCPLLWGVVSRGDGGPDAHSFGEWFLEGMEDRIAHSFGEWSLETGVGNPECLSRLLGWIGMRSIPVFGVLGASIGARGFSSEPEFSEVMG